MRHTPRTRSRHVSNQRFHATFAAASCGRDVELEGAVGLVDRPVLWCCGAVVAVVAAHQKKGGGGTVVVVCGGDHASLLQPASEDLSVCTLLVTVTGFHWVGRAKLNELTRTTVVFADHTSRVPNLNLVASSCSQPDYSFLRTT